MLILIFSQTRINIFLYISLRQNIAWIFFLKLETSVYHGKGNYFLLKNGKFLSVAEGKEGKENIKTTREKRERNTRRRNF